MRSIIFTFIAAISVAFINSSYVHRNNDGNIDRIEFHPSNKQNADTLVLFSQHEKGNLSLSGMCKKIADKHVTGNDQNSTYSN